MHITKSGRATVHLRDGSRQLYSRCLMEAHLKRHLTYNEVVHHVNGDPTDDRIENLALIARSEHSALHGKEMSEGWARRRERMKKNILRAQGRT